MGIHLFNPPAPHADPTEGGFDQANGRRCGNCVSVPRYWAITITQTGPDAYAALYAGRHVLTRQLKRFEQGGIDSICWWAKSIDLTKIGYGIGSMNLYQSDLGPGQSGIIDWYVELDGGQQPGFPGDAAVYWMHGSGAPDFFPDTRPFRCLQKNSFYPRGDLASGNFPVNNLSPLITVEPFWF